MSANKGAGTHTGQEKIDKRVEALEQDVTEITVLLNELLQREEMRYPTVNDDNRILN